jgi:hypothetical protein
MAGYDVIYRENYGYNTFERKAGKDHGLPEADEESSAQTGKHIRHRPDGVVVQRGRLRGHGELRAGEGTGVEEVSRIVWWGTEREHVFRVFKRVKLAGGGTREGEGDINIDGKTIRGSGKGERQAVRKLPPKATLEDRRRDGFDILLQGEYAADLRAYFPAFQDILDVVEHLENAEKADQG